MHSAALHTHTRLRPPHTLLSAPGWQQHPSSFDIWLERARLGWRLNKVGKRQQAQQGALSHPFQPNQASLEKQSACHFFWHFPLSAVRVLLQPEPDPPEKPAAESSPWPPSPISAPQGLARLSLTIFRRGIISCSVMEHHKAQFTFIKPRTDHAVEAEVPPTLSMLLLTCLFWLKTCSGGLMTVTPKENPFRQRMCTHKVPVHPREVPYRHVPEVAAWVGASTCGAAGGPGCHG